MGFISGHSNLLLKQDQNQDVALRLFSSNMHSFIKNRANQTNKNSLANILGNKMNPRYSLPSCRQKMESRLGLSSMNLWGTKNIMFSGDVRP